MGVGRGGAGGVRLSLHIVLLHTLKKPRQENRVGLSKAKVSYQWETLLTDFGNLGIFTKIDFIGLIDFLYRFILSSSLISAIMFIISCLLLAFGLVCSFSSTLG